MQVFFKHFASKNQLPGLSVTRTLVENGLNSMNTTQQILIRRDYILENAAGFYNPDEIILSKLYVRFAENQGEDLKVSVDIFFILSVSTFQSYMRLVMEKSISESESSLLWTVTSLRLLVVYLYMVLFYLDTFHPI